MIVLRDYQHEAVNNVRASYVNNKRAPLLVLPTGAGKTICFAHIAANASARGKRVFILVHRVELLRQTSAALMKSGVDHGLINPKFTPHLTAKVQVASVQTLVNRLHKQPFTPDLVIVDEAHHATAGTWRKIIQAFPNARVLGVTATPVRSDGIGLGTEAGGLFDDLIVGPQIAELIARGYLVKPIVYAPLERLDLSGIRVKMGDYDKEQLAERLDKPHITGSAVAHYTKYCPGAPAVAFCVSIAHAQHVAEEFRAAGYRAYSVDGTMDDDTRKRILNGLGNGHVQIVTSCDLISEGTDIPAIVCGIFLRPTQSMGLFVQQGGRALRPVYANGFDLNTDEGRLAAIAASSKKYAIILDHVGNVFTHGQLDEPRQWSLDGEEKKKRKKNNEPTIPTRQCDKCYAVHAPAPACPACGHVYEIPDDAPKQVDGELQELTPEMAAAMKRKKTVEVAKARTLEELEAIAVERGYKKSWALHLYKARQAKNNVPVNQ